MQTVSDLACVDLRHYLLDHQSDIALSINDFGKLRRLFVEVIGRGPQP